MNNASKQEVLKLKGKPYADHAKRKLNRKILDNFKDLEQSEMFKSILGVLGIRSEKKS